MRIFGNKLPKRKIPCVAAIGAFDGVHLGHQKILNKVISRAKHLGINSLVITFDSHPRKFLKNNYVSAMLTSNADKAVILKELGIDCVWFLKTDRDLLNMEAHDFLLLVNKYFRVVEFVAGDDFRFGKDALHGAHTLNKLADKFDFGHFIFKKKKFGSKSISSSLVRQMVASGDVVNAARFLGKPYSLYGVVVSGKGNGKRFGFPTANILPDDYIIPAGGVYAGKCVVNGREYIAAINIGNNPTVNNNNKQTIEAHLIGFKKNIIGQNVRLIFIKRIRDEKKFSSLEDLITAIRNDVQHIMHMF